MDLLENLDLVHVLLIPVYTFGLFYILWIMYLAVMNLKRVRDLGLLHPNVRILGYPILIVGITLDVILNIIPMTILFLDLPREYTISSRLERYLKTGGWRGKIATYFEYLLDPFDPDGNHI